MSKHYVIYSHGFGVRKDGRGLLTDIAATLPEYEHIFFDYNDFDDTTNTLTARPLDQQAEMLRTQIATITSQDKEAVIDIIAHSQGCVVAALANPKHIRRVVFLAPPAQFLGLEKRDILVSRAGAKTTQDGTVYMPRRDGSTTIIKEDYWKSREGIRPIELYTELVKNTELIIVSATKDEILTSTDFTGLAEGIQIVQLEADHDFTGTYRPALLDTITDLLNNK